MKNLWVFDDDDMPKIKRQVTVRPRPSYEQVLFIIKNKEKGIVWLSCKIRLGSETVAKVLDTYRGFGRQARLQKMVDRAIEELESEDQQKDQV